jgi:predicted lipid-binding transport protein (Tim44 family)
MSYTTHAEKRYGALRVIGTVYKVLGVIMAVLTVLAALGICLSSMAGGAALSRLDRFDPGWGGMRMAGGLAGGLIVGLFTLLYGLGLAIGLYGLGEGLFLMLALEENTRATAMLLERQSRTVTQPLSPPAPSSQEPKG